MRAFTEPTIDDLWIKALDACQIGRLVAPRGMTTLEVPDASCFELTNPGHSVLRNPYRKLNYGFMFAEFFWMLGGHNDVASISRFNKKIAEYSDDGYTFFGAYGPRLESQIGHVIHALKTSRDTRQAVMSIWRPSPPITKDVPCTVMMHFMIRDFKLELNVYMRSNDVWLGFPYDVFNFTSIQKYVASAVDCKLGTYRHIVGSMHLYAGDVYKIAWARRHHPTHPSTFELPGMDHREAGVLADEFPKIESCKFEPNCSYASAALNVMQSHLMKRHDLKIGFIRNLEEEAKRVHAEIGNSPDSSAPGGSD